MMSSMGAPRIDMEPQIPGSPFTGRVLLVDDRHEDVELLAIMLAPLEASVVIAGSAKEALAILDEQIVDLVVTDLNMPGKSGLELAREVLARREVPALIFMTGSQLAEDRTAALELGAVAYLKKPVDVDQLIGLAREILRLRCAARTSAALVDGVKVATGVH